LLSITSRSRAGVARDLFGEFEAGLDVDGNMHRHFIAPPRFLLPE
jgi:hypothetical protein